MIIKDFILNLIPGLIFSIGFPMFYSSVLSMRYGKRKYLMIVSPAFVILAVIVFFIKPPQYVSFFGAMGCMLAGLFIFSDDKPLKKILYMLIPYGANIVQSIIYVIGRSVLMPDYMIVFGSVDIIDIFFYDIVLIPILFLLSKWVRHKKPTISDLTIVYVVSIVFIQMIVLTFIMYVYYTNVSIVAFLTTLIVYMLVSLLLSVFVIRYTIHISREQSRKELAASRYEQLSVQYGQLRSSYIGYKKLRHDLKDHIRVIQGLLQRGETNELNEYAKKLTDNWDSLSSKTFCDVPAVDIVLADKYNIASGCGIKTEFAVSGVGESEADSIYLCSIFSNILNNALEAAQHCVTEPYIELHSGIRMDNLVITCRNSMPQSVPEKEDPQDHGYGLNIIKELAAMLDGNFVYEHDDTVFTAIVTIPVRKKEGAAK